MGDGCEKFFLQPARFFCLTIETFILGRGLFCFGACFFRRFVEPRVVHCDGRLGSKT